MDTKKIKLWSTLGQRATFGMHMLDIAKANKDLMIVTADVSTSAGLDRFKKQYNQNFIDVGISEQNMIGVAAGIANMNYKVFTTTFSPFQTLRCCEQIKINLGYMKNSVFMFGLASGLVLGNLGYSHCSIEDIGVLRSIPNIDIVSPADSFELTKCINYLISYDKPVYVRLTGGANNQIVYEKDYDFELGKGIVLEKGQDIVIIGNGSVVANCVSASKILIEKNYKPTVINMHTIKPIDEKLIVENLANAKIVVTVEEHNIIGGLYSAVSEVITKNLKDFNCKVIPIGINDEYSKAGSYDFLLKKFNLTPELIAQKILAEM